MARAANAEQVRLWRQRIDSQARSGLSVVRFCQAHGLQPYNFYFWRRKLANSGQSELAKFRQGNRDLPNRRLSGGGDSKRGSTRDTRNSDGDGRVSCQAAKCAFALRQGS